MPFSISHALSTLARDRAGAAPRSAPPWEAEENGLAASERWARALPGPDEDPAPWLARFAAALSDELSLPLRAPDRRQAPGAWSQAWAAAGRAWAGAAAREELALALAPFELGPMASGPLDCERGAGAARDPDAFSMAWGEEVFPHAACSSWILGARPPREPPSEPGWRLAEAAGRAASLAALAWGFPAAASNARSWPGRRDRLIASQRAMALGASLEAERVLAVGGSALLPVAAWARSKTGLFGPLGVARDLCGAALAWLAPSTRPLATLVWIEGASRFADKLADENPRHHWTYDDPGGAAAHFRAARLLWLLAETPDGWEAPAWGRACLERALSAPHFDACLESCPSKPFLDLCSAALGAGLGPIGTFVESVPSPLARSVFRHATVEEPTRSATSHVGDPADRAHMALARALGRNPAHREAPDLGRVAPIKRAPRRRESSYDPALESAFLQGQMEGSLRAPAPKARARRI